MKRRFICPCCKEKFVIDDKDMDSIYKMVEQLNKEIRDMKNNSVDPVEKLRNIFSGGV